MEKIPARLSPISSLHIRWSYEGLRRLRAGPDMVDD
jgi:hypothetical protein